MCSGIGEVGSCDRSPVPAVTAITAARNRAALCITLCCPLPGPEFNAGELAMHRIGWTLVILMAWGCRAERRAEGPTLNEVATSTERPDPWREARGRGIDFRAIGQEPGWYLEIDDG